MFDKSALPLFLSRQLGRIPERTLQSSLLGVGGRNAGRRTKAMGGGEAFEEETMINLGSSLPYE